jgi:hypothetical protein
MDTLSHVSHPLPALLVASISLTGTLPSRSKTKEAGDEEADDEEADDEEACI